MKYAVKAIYNDGVTKRYVKWCDEHWYETTKDKLQIFTRKEAMKIAEQLASHYIYNVILESDAGEEYISQMPKVKPIANIEKYIKEHPIVDDSYLCESHIIDDVKSKKSYSDDDEGDMMWC